MKKKLLIPALIFGAVLTSAFQTTPPPPKKCKKDCETSSTSTMVVTYSYSWTVPAGTTNCPAPASGNVHYIKKIKNLSNNVEVIVDEGTTQYTSMGC